VPNDIAHFAIHADDCQRAKSFYERVFGWSFVPWGPPGFWRIHTSPDAAIHGALQQRRTLLSGEGLRAFECSISVADVLAIAKAIRENGGKVTLDPFEIEGVGTMVMFEDTESNLVCAMQYMEGIQ
jgi:predicted enzyme related to lactoylglutathione lyase